MSVFVSVCVSVCVFVSVCVSVCACACMCVYVCMYSCVRVYVCVCMSNGNNYPNPIYIERTERRRFDICYNFI